MKKTKRKKSTTAKAVRSAKGALRKTGAGNQTRRKEGCPRDWYGVNA